MNYADHTVPSDPTAPNATDPSSPPSLDDQPGSSSHPTSTRSGPFPQVKLRIKLGRETPTSAPQIMESSIAYRYGNNDEEASEHTDPNFKFSAVPAHHVRDLITAAAVIEGDGSEANGDNDSNNDALTTPKKELRERKKASEQPGSSSSKKGGSKGSKKRGRKAKNAKASVKKDEDEEEEEKEKEQEGENGEDNEDEDEIFEVERIIDHDWAQDGELLYKVKWVGYGPEYDTFEPVSQLGAASQRINEYKRSLPVETRQEIEAGGPQKKNKKKGRPSKGGGSKASKRSRRSTSPQMPSDESEEEKEDDKDDDFKVEKGGAASSSRSRGRPPKSKGELKLFEKPKRDANSSPRPKRQFLENRQGWLNESDTGASDSETEEKNKKEKEEKKKEEKKEKEKEKEKEVVVKKERRVTESPAPKKETKKRGREIEETPAPVTNGARHSSTRGVSSALVEGMYRHESGEVDVMITEGRNQRIVPLREAFDLAGFGLVQFLADRFQFQA